MALCFAIPGGRASPTDFAAAVTTALVMPCALDQKRPSSTRLFNKRLCEFGFCHGAALHETRKPNFTNRLFDCCRGGTGRTLRSGLRGTIFTRWSCKFGFCRGAVLCNPMRPNFTTIKGLCDLLWRLSWPCSLQSQEAELHQQTLRLLCRQL